MNEYVLIQSKQHNVVVKKSGKISYSYEFKTEATKVLKEHSEEILKNPNFELIEKTKERKNK